MKHHLYQLYYGGMKQTLKNHYYCQDCNTIIKAKSKDKFHYKLKYTKWPTPKNDK